MKRQGVQSTWTKTTDVYLSKNNKTNLFFCVTLEPSDYDEEKIYYDICGCLPITSNEESIYIYVIYVHDCNVIQNPPMKNRSDKEMI